MAKKAIYNFCLFVFYHSSAINNFAVPSPFLNVRLRRTSVETQHLEANGQNVLLCSQDQHNYITLYLRTEEN